MSKKVPKVLQEFLQNKNIISVKCVERYVFHGDVELRWNEEEFYFRSSNANIQKLLDEAWHTSLLIVATLPRCSLYARVDPSEPEDVPDISVRYSGCFVLERWSICERKLGREVTYDIVLIRPYKGRKCRSR